MKNIYDYLPGNTARKFKEGDFAIVKWPDSHHMDENCRAEYEPGTIVRIVEVIKNSSDEYYHCKALRETGEEGWFYHDRELDKISSDEQKQKQDTAIKEKA